MLNAFVILKIG